MKIFDAHLHVGKWVGEADIFGDREVADANGLREFMGKFGVDKALVVPNYSSHSRAPFEGNKVVLDCLELDGIFGGLWVSPDELVRTREVLDSLPIDKVKVLKMSPDAWPDGVSLKEESWGEDFREGIGAIVETAKRLGLVLQIHTGSGKSRIENFDSFVERYGEELKLHFVHMGGTTSGHLAFVPRFVEWLNAGYDFYCDTSFGRGFAPAWLVRELEAKCPEGLDRVLFASDHPWGFFTSELQKVLGIETSEDILKKIVYKNAERVYGKQ